MKSEVGIAPLASPKGTVSNLRDVVVDIVNTFVYLGRPQAPSYIVTLLRGDKSDFLNSDDHQEFETYGTMSGIPRIKLRMMLYKMRAEGLLEANTEENFRLILTKKGESFLHDPYDIHVPPEELRFSSEQFFIFRQLREWRLTAARHHEIAPYQLFGNMTLDELVLRQPKTQLQLTGIKGFNQEKIETYGTEILNMIKQLKKEYAAIDGDRLKIRLRNPTHQRVFRMFTEEFKTVSEIAVILGIKNSTVRAYLMDFHKGGQIDMRPHIDEWVNSRTLFRVTEYFRENPKAELLTASQELRLPYIVVLMCKTYLIDTKAPPAVRLQTA